MTKENFTPTKKQLEELAKAAKVDYFIENIKKYGKNSEGYINHDDVTLVPTVFFNPANRFWQPHKRRDQIAMILDGIDDEQQKLYSEALWKEIYKTKHVLPMVFGGTVHPSISCKIFCEILNLEEGE